MPIDRFTRLLAGSIMVTLALSGCVATTLEVKNVSLGLVNRDNGAVSEHFLAAVGAAQNVRQVIVYPTERELGEAIERREVLGGIILPPDLSIRVARGDEGRVGLLLDGRRVNAAQIVTAYISDIAATTGLPCDLAFKPRT